MIINEDSRFDQPLDNLPPGLEILKLGTDTYSHPLYSLPAGLKVFIFNIEIESYEYGIQNLPESIEALMLYMHFADLPYFDVGAGARIQPRDSDDEEHGQADSDNDVGSESGSYNDLPDDIHLAIIDRIINKITLPDKVQSLGLKMFAVSKDIATKIIYKLRDKYPRLNIQN